MNVKKLLLAAALTGGVAAGAPTFAQDSAASHLYIGGSYGEGHWRSMCQSTAANCDDTNPSVSVFAGYHINRIFSAEAAFRNYGEVKTSTASIKGKGWEIDGIAAWPVFQQFSVYGKLGIKRSVVKGDGTLTGDKETAYGPTYGLGVQFDFNKNVAMRGEWQAYPGVGGSTLPKGDIDVLSVGVLWQFR